jgi:putative ABC transport system permease protein
MFFLGYLRRELRLRIRQSMVIAVGLAVGIGLVVVVTAAANGVRDAQAAVLHSLYGIGTDISVTTASGKPPARTSGKGMYSPGSNSQNVDELSGALGLMDQSYVSRIAHLHDVASAEGGLAALTEIKMTIPSAKQLDPGGQPPPINPIENSVDAIDTAHTQLGPYSSGTLSSGRGFRAADAKAYVAVVDDNYAVAQKLTVGSSITMAGHRFTVIGLLRQSQGGGAKDVYIPLAIAQQLAFGPYGASMAGKVDTIYATAASAADIPAVQSEIEALLPSATVSTSSSLASAISGSLSSASSLANDLGRWLAVTVLLASFVIASLLVMAAVGRRTREFGTLKAIGWSSRRIVSQVMGESLVMGVAGAILGIALGLCGAAMIDQIAPSVSATVGLDPGTPAPENISFNASGSHSTPAAGYDHTVAVHMSAPVTVTIIALAVALALVGGIVAGSFGSWRAARLRPAAALSRVE